MIGIDQNAFGPFCRLHANVFALPEGTVPGPAAELRGLGLPTLVSSTGGPPIYTATMPVSFEQMQAAVFELPRSDCEPDGFFLVTGGRAAGGGGSSPPERGGFWRLNGHMHELRTPDGAAWMHRLELNGECPEPTLDAVLRAAGWPATALVFELVQEGVALAEPEFRAWAKQPTA